MKNLKHFLSFVVFLIQKINAVEHLTCPVGFNMAYDEINSTYICYRKNSLESFRDKYKNCNGNLYSLELYQRLNITKTKSKLWTDFITLYPGGPFVNYKYGEDEPEILFDIRYISAIDNSKELCLIRDDDDYVAVDCEEKHNRYCFVKPYSVETDWEKCDEIEPSYKFYNPEEVCLMNFTVIPGLTLLQAKELCESKNSSMLSKGWIYANMSVFNKSSLYPMDKKSNAADESLTKVDISEENVDGHTSNWAGNNIRLWALKNGVVQSVDQNYIFSDILCERSFNSNITLDLSVNLKNQIVLSVGDNLDESDIYCFTDSLTYHPTKVKTKYVNHDNIYLLSPIDDGYYWCFHIHPETMKKSFSNQVLFIKEYHSLWHIYAVKMFVNKYIISNLDTTKSYWKNKLAEYIIYCTKYNRSFDDDFEITENNKEFNFGTESNKVVKSFKIKRLYLDKRTMLVHIYLNPDIIPHSCGVWNDIEVVYMRPVYSVGKFDDNNTCKGNFNEGIICHYTKTKSASEVNEDFLYDGIQEHMIENDEVSDLMMEICNNCELNLTNSLEIGGTTIEAPVTEASPLEEKFTSLEYNIFRSEKPTTITPPTNIIPSAIIYFINLNTDSKTAYTAETVEITESTDASTTETTVSTENRIDRSITHSFEPIESTIIENYHYNYITDTFVPRITTSTESTTQKVTSPIPAPTTSEFTDTTTDTTTTEHIIITPMPGDVIEQILEDLEQLLQDETSPILIEDINEIFNQVNSLLDDQDVIFPGELLQLLEEVGARVDLNGSLTAMLVGENIAMLLADVGPDNPVLGISVAVRDTDEFAEDSFAFYTEFQDHISANGTEAAVFLPPSLTALTRRISFIVYRDDRAFNDSYGVYTVNSRVISVSVAHFTGFESGEVLNIHTSPRISDPGSNITRGCAYWRFLDDGAGFWSQDGCTFIVSRDPEALDICRCDHLTHFAEILIPLPVFSQTDEDVLELLSVIGCLVSIVGLSIIIITSILFKSWRTNFRNQIWLQLCVSLYVMTICFIIVVFAEFDGYGVICMLTGITLHYSLLASFCWMLIVAIKSYRDLVLIFARQVSHKLLLASSFAWGVPLVVVGILLIADPISYFNRFEEMYASSNFCYPSGLSLWLSVYAPVAAMLIANCTMFVLIVRNIGVAPKNLRYQRAGDKREALNCARLSLVLVFFFGLPWFFGLFAYNIIAAYLFTCMATLQGFVLFVFIVLGNYETRNLWLLKLKPRKIMNKHSSGRSDTMLF